MKPPSLKAKKRKKYVLQRKKSGKVDSWTLNANNFLQNDIIRLTKIAKEYITLANDIYDLSNGQNAITLLKHDNILWKKYQYNKMLVFKMAYIKGIEVRSKQEVFDLITLLVSDIWNMSSWKWLVLT